MNDSLASTRTALWWTFRSNLTRLALAGLLLSLTAMLTAGCRSGGENDLVARELRMQEDQLYAMEDYLTQYQQLLRKCRAENASLKCELDERSEELPEPAARNRRRNGVREPSRLTTPPVVPPVLPEADETPATSPENIQLPEVPPLEETTDSNSTLPDAESLHEDPHAVAELPSIESADVQNVAAIETEADVAAASSRRNLEQDAPATMDLATRISLDGEVVENAGGGSRLLVDVAPLTSDGEPASYFGGLSLMVLAPGNSGQPQSLARWDFSAEDAQAAIAETDHGRAMRFYLELPVDAAIDEPVQLWARLLPETGEKLLAHADIDFQQPGPFSSVVDPAAPRESADQQEQKMAIEQSGQDEPDEISMQVVEHDRDEPRRPIQVDVTDGSWSVARPDEPQGFAPHENEPTGSWRTASEPLPTIAAPSRGKEFSRQPSRVRAATRSVERAAYTEIANALPPRRFEMPTWSPERAGIPAASDKRGPRTATLPAWSPDR